LFTLLTEVNKIVNRNLKLGEAEKEVVGILRAGGLEPVVMKGSRCAARYPAPELRTGGDIDLYVPEADFPRAEALLREERVAVVPGNAFGRRGEGFVRCSYAASLKNIEEAMDRMERFVRRH
jgi:aspartate/methionine/tyrosine aminotransferase